MTKGQRPIVEAMKILGPRYFYVVRMIQNVTETNYTATNRTYIYIRTRIRIKREATIKSNIYDTKSNFIDERLKFERPSW